MNRSFVSAPGRLCCHVTLSVLTLGKAKDETEHMRRGNEKENISKAENKLFSR